MKRLTDKRTAEALKHNAEGLVAKGFDVPIDHQKKQKLARSTLKNVSGKQKSLQKKTE